MIRFLRNFLFRDWLLKLFSLTLATLTWLAVSFSLRQRVVPVPDAVNLAEKPYFDVPVTIVSHNQDVSMFKTDPSEVDITLRGNKTVLEQLPKSDLRVIVDLTGAGLKQAQPMPVEVIAPAGITYVRISPSNLVQILPPNAAKPVATP